MTPVSNLFRDRQILLEFGPVRHFSCKIIVIPAISDLMLDGSKLAFRACVLRCRQHFPGTAASPMASLPERSTSVPGGCRSSPQAPGRRQRAITSAGAGVAGTVLSVLLRALVRHLVGNRLPLHAAGRVAAHQILHLGNRYAVEVTGDGVFEATRGHGELE